MDMGKNELPRLPPEMIEHIFTFLDYPSLCNCRLTSRHFYALFNPKVTNFWIQLRHYQARKDMLIVKDKIGFSKTKTGTMTLSKLEEKLKGTPLKNIWMEIRETNLTLPDVNQLLVNYGHCVKYLSSELSLSAKIFFNFVEGHFKNIEYLSLDPAIIFDWEKLDNLSLRQLKTLRFKSSKVNTKVPWTVILQKLILNNNFAPVLENVHGFPVDYLTDPEVVTKIHMFKSITYDSVQNSSRKFYRSLYGTEETLTHLTRLSESKSLRLEKLQLSISLSSDHHQNFQENCKIYEQTFTKILQKNKETLCELEIQPLTPFFEHIQLPRLNKLMTLRLNDFSPMEGEYFRDIVSFFPPGLKIQDKFPSVSHIDLSVFIPDSNDPLSEFEQFFHPNSFSSSEEVFPNVRHLKLTKYQPKVCIERLSKILPNVTSLALDLGLDSLIDILPTCFSSFRLVTNLTLEIHTSTFNDYCLDRVITGIPEPILIELIDQEEYMIVDADQWRENPGICQLKNLELLKFILNPGIPLSTRIPHYLPFITKNSKLYGFDLMPDLEVVIEFHESSTRSQIEGLRRMLHFF